MPSSSSSSPPFVEIVLNDALKELGVKKFTREDGLFTIYFESSADTLRFGLETTRAETLENFEGNAKAFGLDFEKIGKFKEAFMVEEYEQLFKSQNGKSKQKKSLAQEFNAFKYGTGIPLAEQIKLNDKYVFLQIIDGKPVISEYLEFRWGKRIL